MFAEGVALAAGNLSKVCGVVRFTVELAPLSQRLRAMRGEIEPLSIAACRSLAVGHLCSQEAAQNRIARQTLGPAPLRFLLAQFGNFAQKPLLNLRLHLDTVEFLLGFHGVTTSRGE